MIRSEHAHLNVVARSHPGLVRPNNEDRFAVTAYRLDRRSVLAITNSIALALSTRPALWRADGFCWRCR